MPIQAEDKAPGRVVLGELLNRVATRARNVHQSADKSCPFKTSAPAHVAVWHVFPDECFYSQQQKSVIPGKI